MKRSKNIQFKSRWNSLYILTVAIVTLVSASCKKQLDVNDPNDPTFAGNVNSEAGIAAYAKGGIYWNGFNYGDGWLGDSYFSLPWGYHELMGDVVGGGQGSNNQTTTMGVPDSFVADPANAAATTFTLTSNLVVNGTTAGTMQVQAGTIAPNGFNMTIRDLYLD